MTTPATVDVWSASRTVNCTPRTSPRGARRPQSPVVLLAVRGHSRGAALGSWCEEGPTRCVPRGLLKAGLTLGKLPHGTSWQRCSYVHHRRLRVSGHPAHLDADGRPESRAQEGGERRLESALVFRVVHGLTVPQDRHTIADEWGRPPLQRVEPFRKGRADLNPRGETVPRGVLLQHCIQPISHLSTGEE